MAAVDGTAPEPAGAWGWPNSDTGPRPSGNRIGWVDGDDLYLEPEASYNVAQRMARDAGGSLPVGSKTLHKRLNERGLAGYQGAGTIDYWSGKRLKVVAARYFI